MTLSTARLTFTPSNWSMEQTVAATVVQDDDAVNDMATITHSVVADSSSNEFDFVSVASVSVVGSDDDLAVLVVEFTPPRRDSGANNRQH